MLVNHEGRGVTATLCAAVGALGSGRPADKIEQMLAADEVWRGAAHRAGHHRSADDPPQKLVQVGDPRLVGIAPDQYQKGVSVNRERSGGQAMVGKCIRDKGSPGELGLLIDQEPREFCDIKPRQVVG